MLRWIRAHNQKERKKEETKLQAKNSRVQYSVICSLMNEVKKIFPPTPVMWTKKIIMIIIIIIVIYIFSYNESTYKESLLSINNNNNSSNSTNNRMLVNVERKFEKIYGCQLTCLCRRVPCRKRRGQLLKESMKSEKNQ